MQEISKTVYKILTEFFSKILIKILVKIVRKFLTTFLPRFFQDSWQESYQDLSRLLPIFLQDFFKISKLPIPEVPCCYQALFQLGVVSATANIIKICATTTTAPSSCSSCSLTAPIRLGAWNEWGCNQAQGTMIYISNNLQNSHYFVGCELQLVGIKVWSQYPCQAILKSTGYHSVLVKLFI